MQERLRGVCEMAEREIRRIAHVMYEERLAELCHLQREAPYDAQYYSAANFAFVDYFDRQARHGGNLSFLPGAADVLRAAGWGDRRIEELKTVSKIREVLGFDSVLAEEIDRHLHEAESATTDQLRYMI